MTVPKPPMIWLPAHPQNIMARPANIRYEALVVHTTAGGRTVHDLAAWFSGGNIRAGMNGSTHFGIGQDGRIGQFVDLSQAAMAHGKLSNPTAKLVQDNAGINPNYWAIGCELLDAGTPGNHTLAQLLSLNHLFAWLWESVIAPAATVTGARLDRDHILGHYQFDGVDRARCPSRPAAWYGLAIQQIGELLTLPPPPPPDPEPEPEPKPEPAPDFFRAYIDSVEDKIERDRHDLARAEEDQWRAAIRLEHDENVLAIITKGLEE